MFRRTASEVLHDLEIRVAHLERRTATYRTASKKIRLDRDVEERVMEEIYALLGNLEMSEDLADWSNPVFEVLAQEKGGSNVSEGSTFQLLKLDSDDDIYVVLQNISITNDSDIIGVYGSLSAAQRDLKRANR